MDVLTSVKTWLDGRPDVQPYQFGAHTHLAASTLRHVFDGQRACGPEVSAELARVLRLAQNGEVFPVGAEPVVITEDHTRPVTQMRKSRDFYATETVRRVGQVLTYCADQSAIGVITADYGVGKTESVKHWRERGAGRTRESVVFEFDEFSSRNTVEFVECLCNLMGVEYAPGMHNGGRTMRSLVAHLVENPLLMILDQCETVNARVMSVARQIWDRTRQAGVGITLLAAPVLMVRLEASRTRDLGAIQSRIGIRAQLRGLSLEEMAAVLKAEGLTSVDEDAFKMWFNAVGGSMRRLMASIDLVQSKHGGKTITTKTLVGVASHLWGMNL